MNILYVNAAFREGSRTQIMAKNYMKKHNYASYETVDLGTMDLTPLNAETLKIYNKAVEEHDFSHPMFDPARQFANADIIVIAAPFWNFGLPAVLNTYLELVCTQGITFDIDEKGEYHSLCKAKELIFLTTAGGKLPRKTHAFGYLKTLSDVFFKIRTVDYYYADELDLPGTDVSSAVEHPDYDGYIG